MALSLQQHLNSRLPTEFLKDEDITCMDKPHEPVSFQHFPSHEDEEDDFFAELTRRLTHHLAARKPESKWVVVGSPESTLNGMGTWSVSSNSSPNGILSPPTTPFGAKEDTWGLIHEVAGEIARLKLNTEVNEYRSFEKKGLSGPDVTAFNFQHTASNKGYYGHVIAQKNQYLQHVRPERVVATMDTFATKTVEHNKIYKQQSSSGWGRQQVNGSWQSQPQNQFYHQTQTGSRNVWSENSSERPLGLPQSAWPPLQKPANQHAPQQHQHQSHVNSRLSTVTFGGPSTRKCSGTGVFLPRGYANPPESAKKKSGPTVVLPAKVVQSLNSNFQDSHMNCHPHPLFNGAFATDYSTIMARSAVYAQQRNSRPDHEIHLPQEWTY